MANAKIEMVKVPQPPVIPPPLFEERVHLVLTIAEAQALADILLYVGGDPELTRRKYADAIQAALRSVKGISSDRNPTDVNRGSGIYFT